MKTIDLVELYESIKLKWKWILLITLAAGAATYWVSSILPKEYRMTTTLLLGRPQGYESNQTGLRIDDILINQKLVGTYGELIKSKKVSRRVIEDLKLDMTHEELRDKVEVNLVRDTEIIEIVVKDNDPVRTMNIATATADAFMDVIKSAMQIQNVQVIDQAEIPEFPIAPRIKFNTVIGLLSGFLLSITWIVLVELTDNTVKSVEELERLLEIPVIGVIPQMDKLDI